MDPEFLRVVESVLLDGIKILGPALIAAIATYKGMKAQSELKLQERFKDHEFRAREHLFDYYKNRQVNLSKSHDELAESLGSLLGQASVYNELDDLILPSNIGHSFKQLSS
jgi:hypothetical protein